MSAPDAEATRFDDITWTYAMRWRCGLQIATQGARCCHKAAACEENCDAELDGHGDHAVTCEKGPWRVGRHEVVAETVAGACRLAGATVLREIPVPELSQHGDAILDVISEGSAWTPDSIIDITVRHPCAERYMPRAAAEDGHAAAKAEEEKQQAYPPHGGRFVAA